MKSDGNIGAALDSELDPERLPAHVGLIMDGNGRWAKKKLMNRARGHEQGSKTVREIVTAAAGFGIPVITLYAFSTENWARPAAEVKALMKLLKKYIVSERDEFMKNDIQINIIGQKDRLPEDVRKEVDATMELTKENSRLLLNLALSYGAREEITRAVAEIAKKVQARQISPEMVSAGIIADHLYTRDIPDPDLIIRTSGEYRLSNFLLWQAAYSELYISDTLWPDFTEAEFKQILIDYQNRDRRFGKV